jgi:two-component SAPR family response regulator
MTLRFALPVAGLLACAANSDAATPLRYFFSVQALQNAPPHNQLIVSILYATGAAFAFLTGFAILLYFRKYGSNQPTVLRKHFYIAPIPAFGKAQVSAIYLMGGFQVFDGQGQNITSQFSPTLKQLFLFILFNCTEKNCGVGSGKIDEMLWPNRVGDSARNNRNVNISKLRTALRCVGNVDIVNSNTLWQTVFGEGVFCDYVEILSLLAVAKSESLPESEACKLLALLGSGSLLPDVDAAWAVAFKTAFVKKTVDILGFMLRSATAYSYSMRYHIADYLLSAGSLNEDAICIKCALLNRMGKRGEAKIAYDSFVSEYVQLTGMEYAASFREVIHSPIRTYFSEQRTVNSE